jgi:hypothetical protein
MTEVKWLLSRLTVEDLIALIYLARYGRLTAEQLDAICLKVDIYCDIAYLHALGLARKKKDGTYEATKKADELMDLITRLLKVNHSAEAAADV